MSVSTPSLWHEVSMFDPPPKTQMMFYSDCTPDGVSVFWKCE